ncbi:MAG: SA1320 family protein, partial [Sarcina sp.]
MNKKESKPQENTSHISNVVYNIENMLAQGLGVVEIEDYIANLKKNEQFPENLELAEMFFDENTSIGACAFVDTNTGETIVGVAGTNPDNEYLGGDILADIKLAFDGGFNEHSPYMEKLNEFMTGLQENGYNVTQTTGHSLGGALAVYVAIFHDIPYSVTYNGAPLFSRIMSAGDWGRVFGSGFFKQMMDYEGKIIRFVSEKDQLNSIADFFWAKYLGEEIFIANGQEHAMIEFLNEAEQEFLLNVLRSKGTNGVNNLSVSFDGGGLCELKASDLTVKNLWGEGGKYSGIIVIDPEAFKNLKNNLVNNMVKTDIEWIKTKAIKLCREKNNTLKNKKESRDEDLIKGIVEGLEGSGLTGVVNRLEETHGQLIENQQLLVDLGSFNKEASLQKFSSSKRWLLDGEQFNKSDISQMLTDVQRAAECLKFEATETGEFDEYIYRAHTRQPLYIPYTISSIVEAYAGLTNSFLEKTEKVFEGKGNRLGKPDGIVDAISDVVDIEDINIDEVGKQIHTVGEIAGGIAENFSNMDEYLSGVMQGGQGSGHQFIKVPDSYEAYLQEHDVLSDVVDIIEAYDLQVEQAADELAREIIVEFEQLIDITKAKFDKIYDVLVDFEKAIIYLGDHMYKEVTSIEVGETIVEDYRYTTKEIKKSHGMLRDFFTEDVRKYISQAEYSIIPIIGNFEYVWTCLDIYKGGLYDIRNYIASIIEKAVYDHYDLDEIISAQKLIT